MAERGQASVELLAGVPAVILAGLIALQLFLTGYSMTLADGAAEAGALALAADGAAARAARDALPAWARADAEIAVADGRVSVEVEPPSPANPLSEALSVTSSAVVREPGG